ncbi:dephospho-CoA kinase [Leucobacter sp. HY1908]
MLLVALTGGIAAGKSTIGDQLEKLGALRIDADQLARDAVAPGSAGLRQIAGRFGRAVVTAEGELDRAALGNIVFSDQQALGDLNGIVHPEVQRLLNARLKEIERAERLGGEPAIVVYEIPLLAETAAGQRAWDLVVTAEAPVETRVARMQELRGMSEAAARARIAQQADEASRRAIADEVIDTGVTPEQTRDQVLRLWAVLKETQAG